MPTDPGFPQIIKKLIERKQAQIRKVYPGLSCFKEGVRQIPVESVPGIRELRSLGGGGGRRGTPTCQVKTDHFKPTISPLYRRNRLETGGEGEGVSVGDQGGCWGEEKSTGTRSPRSGPFHPRKELKDPDQLYTTLKNLLAQIKVGGRL